MSTFLRVDLCFVSLLPIQLPWAKVKEEMTEQKGLDGSVADKIGDYVKRKGVSLGISLAE